MPEAGDARLWPGDSGTPPRRKGRLAYARDVSFPRTPEPADMRRPHAAFARAVRSSVGLALFASLVAAGAAGAPSAPFHEQRVTYASGAHTLVGYVYKPDGDGPFPTLVWNHGSEQDPASAPQFDSVAAAFVPAGYVVVAPVRRGHGASQGEYIQDRIRATFQREGPAAAEQLMVRLMEGEQLDDQLAGLAYAKTLAFVDTSRLVVAGCSYGGIETLLAAERGPRTRACGADHLTSCR